MRKLLRISFDFFAWALAINGAVLFLQLFLMFALGLCSMTWGRGFYFFTDRIHMSEAGIVISIVAGLFMAIRWETKPPANVDAWRYWLQTVMRYILAYIFLDYGFAKIFKGQFTTSLSTLDVPLGQINAFQLAWRFFGYSYVYAIFLAASEIIGGLLLFFRRTTLLATAILVPVTINIAVVNFTHEIGVKEEAVLLMLMTLFLFLTDFARLKALFWDHVAVPARTFPRFWSGHGLQWARVAVIAFIVAFTLSENVILYFEYERTTTPLHGAWDVQSYVLNGTPLRAESDARAWKTLYVDTDRELTIRTRDPKVRECESDVKLDPGRHAFRVTDVYKNDVFMQGIYELRGAESLIITGRQGADAIEVSLRKRQ